MIGGGLLGLEAAYGLQQHGLDVHVVQSGPVLMNQQLDEEAGGILRRVVERARHHGAHRHAHDRDPQPRLGDRGGVRRRDRDRLRHGRGDRRHPAQRRARRGLRADRGAGHRRRRPDAHRSTTRTSTRSASARSTAARCTGWSRRCGSRPRCWPTTSPAPTRRPPTTARGSPPSSRWPASTWPPMGIKRPGARGRRVRPVLRAARAASTSRSSSATASWSAPPCSATSARSRS